MVKTLNGEDFMLGSRDGVFMFSTNTNLALIAEAPSLYMDGTFQICPHLFYQVFTLHAFKHGQQFPLVYFLLPGKSREAYNTSFILLKEAAPNIGLEVEPQRVLTDFQLALQQSFAICFPQAERKGCHSTTLRLSGERYRILDYSNSTRKMMSSGASSTQ